MTRIETAESTLRRRLIFTAAILFFAFLVRKLNLCACASSGTRPPFNAMVGIAGISLLVDSVRGVLFRLLPTDRSEERPPQISTMRSKATILQHD